MTYQVKRFPYDGTVDADGHILEPDWLWTQYLEAAYQDKAMGIRTDEDGFEYLQLDAKPSRRTVKGSLGLLGAMGELDLRPSPQRRYMDNLPFGASDPAERVELLDQENLEAALLYPTIGLLWEAEVEDPEISLAYCRAYNRWLADFCRGSAGRLVPIAHLTLTDAAGSAVELERAVADGCKGGFVCPFTHSRKPHGHTDHDVLFAKAVELGVPLAIHPTFEPDWAVPVRFKGLRASEAAFFYNVMGRQGMQQAWLSFWTCGTFDRFPDLQLGILEAGSGWVGAFLDRMDAVWDTGVGKGMKMALRPSDYFVRQCFVSGDPDETAAPLTRSEERRVGKECA